MSFSSLIEKAKKVRNRAYAPYSAFKVGAAIQGKSGKIYVGCNVENGSYSLTSCAERNAVFKAVSEGETEFLAIAIVTDHDEFIPPCGACRQVLVEFGNNIEVISANLKGEWKQFKLSELIPFAFHGDFLRKNDKNKK